MNDRQCRRHCRRLQPRHTNLTSIKAVGVALAQCGGGGAACSAAVGEAAKLIPVVGHLFAGASTFLSVRWLGLQVVAKAKEASNNVYGVLLESPPRPHTFH
mmetsp:Transcript_32606/g.65049  ORF Transcript_32606/g.65049 Transcript_32606/m.65049 type:complete len:101 (+) Transcript_32606:331-633(+)